MKIVRHGLWTSIVAIAITACAGPGAYIWVDQYPESPAPSQTDADYVIQTGDMLGVSVYEQAGLTSHARVRADGKISVALVGDLLVAGKRPVDVATEIGAKLRQYIKDPNVTVSVEEIHPISVSVVGEVGHPGIYQLEASANVVQALAAAGGPTEFADRDLVFVLRRRPTPVRIRFTYDKLVRNDPRSIGFTLKAGDTVVVE